MLSEIIKHTAQQDCERMRSQSFNTLLADVRQIIEKGLQQVHIRTEENDYFIDLVFYNYMLRCFVLIDLKADRLSFQDVGQMDMYLHLYDTFKKQPTDNPTIGIVLCSQTNGDVVRYSSLAENPQMYAAKYELYLPSQEELAREIERQKEIYRLKDSLPND